MSEETKLMLIAPSGLAIDRVLTEGIQTANANEIAPDGTVCDYSANDFPTMEVVDTLGEHVSDAAGNDFLGRHCRLVTAPATLDVDDETLFLDAWPEEIVTACVRCDTLAWSIGKLQEFRQGLPKDYRDSTITTVLDKVVLGRLQDEFDQLDEKIRLFRKDRVEPTVITGALGEEEEEPEDVDV